MSTSDSSPSPSTTITATAAPALLTKPAGVRSSHADTAERPFIQTARTPLIPERILKSHGAWCAIDTRFRAAARLLQYLWLRDHDILTASSNVDGASTSDYNPRTAFGSILSAEAANAGRNFLSPAIHRLALQEWLLCEEDAAIDEERLFGNALSSMPLAFNLFGPMALDLKLATSVFRVLLPGFVQDVEQIVFEHSPARRDQRFLADRTAFDLAVRVITPNGEPATVFIEVKYSESMEGPAARMRDRYNEASRQVRLYRDPDSAILRSFAIEQLWREHMLAQLAVDNGVTPRAVFMAIGPRLNRRVQAAFRVYQAELAQTGHPDKSDHAPFVPMTLETVIEAVAAAGVTDLAQVLWHRYCDFDRVYRLVMQELADDATVSSTASSLIDDTKAGVPVLQSARRRVFSRRRERSTALARTSSANKQAVR